MAIPSAPSPALARLPAGNPGPASPPSGNPGAMVAALAKVREAVHLLEMALPEIETGSDQHKAVVDAIQKLGKAVPASDEIPGVQQSALMGLQQRAQQTAALRQLMAQQQAQQQAPAEGATPPQAAA